MRCYHLCNMYLIGIHAGIQSAHAQMELFNTYKSGSAYELRQALQSKDAYARHQAQVTMHLYNWSENHKTTICLNGGYASHLQEFYEFLAATQHEFPYTLFRESEDALNNVLTNVAIVLPERVYQLTPVVRSGEFVLVHPVNEAVGKLFKFVIDEKYEFEGNLSYRYTEFEIELIKRLARLRLMN